MSVFSLPPSSGLVNVTHVNGATDLTPADCGTVILGETFVGEAAQSVAVAVNLPAPQRGLYFKFIVRPKSLGSGKNITVKTTSDGTTGVALAVGSVTVNEVPTNVVAAKGTLTFVAEAATCGDHAEMVCDGVHWFVVAVGDAAGSVTLA